MNRDPLYRKIVEALARPLDGNVFQACAAALIGRAHPNLAPMPGGNDGGMDGAFGAPDGPWPLVCTVQSDVIGNFRQNIGTYLAMRTGPMMAVVATSQALSNLQKRNLHGAAKELGVTLANIYDAPYFADQLYRDPKWRLELLGITGDSPPLSVLPRIGRFVEPELLIGRDEDLAWLKQVEGDALLVGQPGSGKTYLHQLLANQGLCLFAVDDSPHRLADAIREQQPAVIVVDDAHVYLQLVADLNRLRAEVGAQFRIHLNCWPGQEAAVQRALNIPDSRVRRLLPLRTHEILALIEHMGIHGPDWLQRLLISQAEGKPGLAVVLAEACKTENVSHIWTGEALDRQLLSDPRVVRGERERCVLAAFAVGGDMGVSFAAVSSALGVPQLELRQITAALGAGGLIEEVGSDRVQVRPPALRAILVRDVFYAGPRSLPIETLLRACFPASTAEVLFSARQRGAQIDLGLLEQLAVAANTDTAWAHFAWVDEECANALLDRRPENACVAAPGLLKHAPHRALHALLDADDAGLVASPSAVEHPRRQIGDWLFPYDTQPNTTIERRSILLDVLEERVHQGKTGNGESFVWALAETLRATFDFVRPSPRSRLEFRSIRGVASHAILGKISALWPRVHKLVGSVPVSHARILFDQIENWCLPQRLSVVSGLADETFAFVGANGRLMLTDMLAIPQCTRAWRTRASQIANWGALDLTIAVDPTFDALYGERGRVEDWVANEQERMVELQAITNELMQRPMADVLTFLAEIKSEALGFGYAKGHLWVVYNHIANHCTDPMEWIDALIAKEAEADFLSPFVDVLALRDRGRYASVVERLLDMPAYQFLAINGILRLSSADGSLLSRALSLIQPDHVRNLRLHDPSIPTSVMVRLLEHPNRDVRAGAVIGEWRRVPAGTVRPDVQPQWRAAALAVSPRHYELRPIFEKEADLAFEWLKAQLLAGKQYLSPHDDAANAAVRVLRKDQRAELLRLFTRDNYTDEFFDLLMGEHVDLFGGWLEYQADEAVRLRPLDRLVGKRWEEMATLALDAHVSPEVLAEHCTPNHWGGMGPISQCYVDQIPAYEALANHPNPRLRKAGERGLAFVRERAQRELARERREDTFVD